MYMANICAEAAPTSLQLEWLCLAQVAGKFQIWQQNQCCTAAGLHPWSPTCAQRILCAR